MDWSIVSLATLHGFNTLLAQNFGSSCVLTRHDLSFINSSPQSIFSPSESRTEYIYIYVVRKGHIFGMLAHVAGNFSDFFVYIPGRIIKGRPPRGILGHDGKCVRICLGLSNSLFGRIHAKRYAAALLVPLSVHVLPCSLPTSRNSFAAYCPACLFLSVRLGETNCTSHSNIASHNTAANSEVFLLFAKRGEISSHHDRTLQMCP